MGAAGDMLMAALYELIEDKEAFISKMNALGLAEVAAEESFKCGIKGTHMRIRIDGVEEADLMDHEHRRHHAHEHEHHHAHEHAHEHHYEHDDEHEHHHVEHSHSGLSDITELINSLTIPDTVKANAIDVYRLIAEAESLAHGRPISDIHFHEVGTKDAVADIVGVCVLMELLSPDEIVVSPINLGSGFVNCAHGLLPVPAPATAHILHGVPTHGSGFNGELCTPTGAALLKHFATTYNHMPNINLLKIGYGMGKKDFKAANCVRAFLGEGNNLFDAYSKSQSADDQIAELVCNLDDCSGERIGFCAQLLLEAGALDAFTTPIYMKKYRPATLLTCLCETNRADYFAKLMLKHTTTFGIRKSICDRYVLSREYKTVSTKYGNIRVKSSGDKFKPEYDDCVSATREYNVTLDEIQREINWVMQKP
jgi:uncharacterized protein (TIGR00299 family) protein